MLAHVRRVETMRAVVVATLMLAGIEGAGAQAPGVLQAEAAWRGCAATHRRYRWGAAALTRDLRKRDKSACG